MPGRWWRGLCAAGMLLHAVVGRAMPVAVPPNDASAEARQAVQWVMQAADHGGRPFAVVDKKQARLHVFDATGRLVGSTPVLLGLAPGDRVVGDVINTPPHRLAPAQRTTPAGRFESEPGINRQGEAIVWLDYDAALAIHRLRPAPAHERRAERLASANPQDHRISFGCVVVPPAFYDAVIAPTLGRQRGVVYVLPEEGPLPALPAAAMRLSVR